MLSLVLAPVIPAQQVFPTGVELVAVDVTVVDRQGRPVADLRAEDFEVKVGGQRRRIASAQLVRQGAPAPAATDPAAASPAAPPSYSSNQDTPPGRLIVLVPDVGWMSTGGGRAATEAAGRFLAKLTPQDRVALITIPVGPSIDFTTDHARVAEAILKVRGGSRQRVMGMRNLSMSEAFAGMVPMGDRRIWGAAVTRECGGVGSGSFLGDCAIELKGEAQRIYEDARATTATSVGALRRVLYALRTIEGPKTVVYISQGLVTGRSSGDLGADRPLEQVAEDAARARVSLYTILVDRAFIEAADVSDTFRPETRFQDIDLFRDGLEAVAGYSGGPLLKTLTTADFAFERVASETSATWLLSFEPERDDRDGKLHEIKVAVGRDGVEVRARPRFVVAPKEASPATAEAHARRSLDALLPETDVPLSVATFTLGEKAGGVRLVVAAEVGLDAGEAETSAVGYRLLDGQGQVAEGAIETGRLDRLHSSGGDALYYLLAVTVKPGAYTLKLAAAASSGRTGSVERAVVARLQPAGGLLLSDLLVAEPGRRESGQAMNVDGRLLGRTARAVLEVRAAATPPSVQFELAPAGEPGASLMAGAVVRPTAEPGCYNAEATLDLASVEAGRYELRAVVLLANGSEAGRVVRPLELLPKP
ncbi:MAG TPA: VWA domain-containing protein [Vicinamibacteria bacterium]|nr:VWA domain-containing protein [Vicinamibacteria bacterium]